MPNGQDSLCTSYASHNPYLFSVKVDHGMHGALYAGLSQHTCVPNLTTYQDWPLQQGMSVGLYSGCLDLAGHAKAASIVETPARHAS